MNLAGMRSNRIHNPGQLQHWQSILALCLLMGLFCMSSSVRADQWGDWSYSTDGTNVTIMGYTGTCANIVIPNIINSQPVRSIGTSAFYSFPLTSITIPNTVTSIGHLAFMGCTNLTTITIGNSVVSIGDLAFWGCSSLAGVYCKGGMPGVGAFAFNYADNATVYYFPWNSGWTDSLEGRPTQVNPAYTQWLTDYGFTTSLTNDYDNDGMLNWQEYLASTSPTNDADRLAIASMGSGANAQISWQAKSNVSYQVMKSQNLLEVWSNAPSGIGVNQQSYQTAPMDGLLQYADPNVAGSTNAFYRVNVVP